mmetsp:Transcript_42838/g.130282  ORF Transcript_42838/g.130282 Transcript_42838/m.130282 type:complete len:135 (-) Transcript_42838:87-491(-)
MNSLRHLYLDGNAFASTIPTEWGEMTALTQIYLNGNDLTGILPQEVMEGWADVKRISVADNRLSGTIPTTMGNMRKLEALALQGNDFTGSVPDELCALVTTAALNELTVRCGEAGGHDADEPLRCSCCTACHGG